MEVSPGGPPRASNELSWSAVRTSCGEALRAGAEKETLGVSCVAADLDVDVAEHDQKESAAREAAWKEAGASHSMAEMLMAMSAELARMGRALAHAEQRIGRIERERTDAAACAPAAGAHPGNQEQQQRVREASRGSRGSSESSWTSGSSRAEGEGSGETRECAAAAASGVAASPPHTAPSHPATLGFSSLSSPDGLYGSVAHRGGDTAVRARDTAASSGAPAVFVVYNNGAAATTATEGGAQPTGGSPMEVSPAAAMPLAPGRGGAGSCGWPPVDGAAALQAGPGVVAPVVWRSNTLLTPGAGGPPAAPCAPAAAGAGPGGGSAAARSYLAPSGFSSSIEESDRAGSAPDAGRERRLGSLMGSLLARAPAKHPGS
ncbi:hypothetical protein FOA52_009591 [Chlamydomonas sp. UWO 241]|nr:hypothetical protein FOA52_009591 [Chlamydomonas sp. UWO 241]